MSYHKDLDEFPEHQLLAELERRKQWREHNYCDYCERKPDTRPCKFPRRHYWNHPIEAQKRALLALLPYYSVQDRGIISQAIANGQSRHMLVMQKRSNWAISQYTHEIESCDWIENMKFNEDQSHLSVTLVTDPKFTLGEASR